METMQWLQLIAGEALERMKIEVASLPERFSHLGDLVVQHEEALLSFATLELDGDGRDSLQAIESVGIVIVVPALLMALHSSLVSTPGADRLILRAFGSYGPGYQREGLERGAGRRIRAYAAARVSRALAGRRTCRGLHWSGSRPRHDDRC
jgi:hypothetical protein